MWIWTTFVTRSIPRWLAPVVTELELERPTVITTAEIEDLRVRLGVVPSGSRVAEHLAERGWLLRTGVHGAWEFVPGDRAAGLSQGDAFLPVRAVLATAGDTPVSVALGSALWLLDMADRAPERPEVAMPSRSHVPVALHRNCRVVRYEATLPTVRVQGLPVHPPAAILVHLASRPVDVRSWAGVLSLLEDLVALAPEEDVLAELEGRPHATRARLSYLLSGVAPDLVARLAVKSAGRVWFGRRGPVRRYDARWNVADTVLPLAPSDLRRRA